ncbi:MAG: histidine kinase [Flavobacteriales bacterium]|nr:histidine kinase [Flavobacteriales bacterium]
MAKATKNNSFRIYPWVFIPLVALVYYTTFYMMSMMSDADYGFDWIAVLIFTIQFGVIWWLSQFTLDRLLIRGWKMNIPFFLLGVTAIVLLNECIYFTFRSIYVTIKYPEFPLFNWFLLTITTLEGLLKGIMIMSLLFSLHFFKRWRLENEENERLKRNELELQNRALKSQLNPHFLFNNLNTLSGLIRQDPVIANEFLKEMSDMYRYILKTTESEVVPLMEEIQFAESYTRLLKKRFGKNFNYSTEVNDFNYVLPPISLHLLLENVIKHNRIDEECPLYLTIKQKEDSLVVENTISRKNNVDSTKKGLQILREQYSFLTNKSIEINEKNNLFSVKLPLLKITR